MSVGQAYPHDTAELHVTGAARYVDDHSLPSQSLHLAFGVSSIASGLIKNMDLSQVYASAGVVAVLSAADLPYANDTSPSVGDEPLLATGEIHYLGQPIFLVIAKSHDAARKAARLAKITYDEQRPILTIDEALSANSRFERSTYL